MVNKNVLALLTKQSLKQWTALFHDALVMSNTTMYTIWCQRLFPESIIAHDPRKRGKKQATIVAY